MQLPLQSRIDDFLNGSPHAVVGASRDRSKYGNKVLRCYIQACRSVFPVNPAAAEIEGLPAFKNLASLPTRVHGVSIITPPAVTLQVVKDAHAAGITRLWMQPGAESPEAVELARSLGLSVIAGDACILVVLGFADH
ncbi:MAG: CoA-binding protein [Phycisphaerales bacterium]|nr:CoA-binding protein [Planctomycetota bacterium]NUQ53871.1 CoA-binding protein [Phycisphaerales bacterium]